MKEYGILLFSSTHYAMEAEKFLKEALLPARIISTPEKIKKSCGFSLKYTIEKEEEIIHLLDDKEILYEGVYHASGKGLAIDYRKVG
ncbi:DUF3343 domain-containing protein [Vagococcus hydrophili]|uniref:DUF3343 domain-containing protein n=1 Tax=Vagococcus hydrophili TaxID=2714947 RepID=A0A6G8AV21_9ENTE|nr:DUF3343 domain-containing protein [Vagococcus hydrophili]QIL48785.1 DUF3343 domain-containing protein [Vagococcus hydrophili]